jgi:hypothetical protein
LSDAAKRSRSDLHGLRADGAASVLLEVRVQPGARASAPRGAHAGRLKLALAAPPEGGRANEAAAALLAELFGVRPSAVVLVRGHSSRVKLFRLSLPFAAARPRLAALLADAGGAR